MPQTAKLCQHLLEYENEELGKYYNICGKELDKPDKDFCYDHERRYFCCQCNRLNSSDKSVPDANIMSVLVVCLILLDQNTDKIKKK